ncbi:molybdopterin molybdotransferase MoeA [Corynebacterium sp. TA-R-1]|uniref:Molybdopterin molybdenumtransferase n=1 Tax=Corynebacterium stercoris TaxID=2943490 RepID=A0ABT1FZY8_9CORY|nr:molybdopterin molybdotransferase MoeA [Corynebacterium stercoris]MCP1387323.1 molybdopterin molybdotransferase MoeA [Corynebacterium stercoris]
MAPHTAPRSIAEHAAAVLALAGLAHPGTQRLPLADAFGRHLAAPATARFAVPPFDNAAMDGFLVHAADLAALPATLPVAGDIPAGAEACLLPAGCAVRVMTGAPVPPGEGIVVVPVEQTDIPRGPVPLPEHVTIHDVHAGRDHIRWAGSNVAAGAQVAGPGECIDAGLLAALVATGVREVDIVRTPSVAVLATGDELVAWPSEITGAQIPNSNMPMLAAIARAAGAEVHALHVPDGTGEFRAALDHACAAHNIVVTSGGVSAGAFDVVREVLESGGTGDAWFGRVAQRPGGPQGLTTFRETPVVCLPGNPVAAFVSAHLYLTPLIRAAAGATAGLAYAERPRVTARAGETLPRPHHSATHVVPVRVDYAGDTPRAQAFSPAAPGSHMVASLVGIDGLALVEASARESSDVPVLLI